MTKRGGGERAITCPGCRWAGTGHAGIGILGN